MSSPTLLRLVDLSKRFRQAKGAKVHAVEHVNMEVYAGETVALVGESGCGKSTLANLVVRLLDPDGGRVFWGNVDVTALSGRALRPHRKLAQLVSQDPYASLNPRAKVGRSVAEPLRVHGWNSQSQIEARVSELLELVGLKPGDKDLYPHQFSGGQRQRICVARAIALNPALVVADEAVSALDVSVRARVLNMLMELQEELSLAYFFVSHDLAVVERMAHRVAVMYLGQIVEMGPRQAIFEDPQHPYTRRLLAAVPNADPRQRGGRARLTGEIPSPVWPKGEGPTVVELAEVDKGHFVALNSG